MTSKKFAKLVMCTELNNNKYYIMEWDGVSSNFNVKYGRVESTEATASYPISKWDSQYNSKVKKGYRDVTHTVSVTVETTQGQEAGDELGKIDDAKVERFITLMNKYSKNLVSSTYTVRYQDVTQAQVDEAQGYIDELRNFKPTQTTEINSKLLELYMVIPRYMSHVKSHLLPNIDLQKTLEQEQDNLDAMAAQVKMYKKSSPKASKKAKKETKNMLDLLGISMKEMKDLKPIQHLVTQLNGKKVESYFEIDKPWEDERFDKWMATQKRKDTRIVVHGTKNTSVIPILEQGLKIRPTGNFQFTGKVYGNGNYFSEECDTSIGYAGYEDDQVLLVYEVHVGNPYTYGSSPQLNLDYSTLQKHGYDCTFLKGYRNNLNQMVIAYNEPQSRIRGIIWLKRK